MASWVPSTPVLGLQPIADTSTTQLHPLGTKIHASHATYGSGEFVYLLGVASTVVGSWATINYDDGSTALLAANAIGPVGVAMSINVASQYGWYQVRGKAVGKAAAGYLDNALVWYQSSGIVDDTISDGNMVHLAKGASAVDTPSAGLAEFEIQYPYTDAIVGND